MLGAEDASGSAEQYIASGSHIGCKRRTAVVYDRDVVTMLRTDMRTEMR